MSLDTVLPDIERIAEDGGLVFLKWDGERTTRKMSVIINKPGTDFQFRKDTDDLESTVIERVSIYWDFFSTG